LQLLIEHYKSPKLLDGERTKCNLVFAEYLCKISKVARKEAFKKIVSFVTLFRECLNSMFTNKNENSNGNNVLKDDSDNYRLNGNNQKDYTEINNTEDAPEISNEFVTEFLDSDPFFFDFERDEVIEITQNFCWWLYDNNYTYSKLTLINV